VGVAALRGSRVRPRDGAPLGGPEALKALAEHLRAATDTPRAEAPEPDERWRLYLQELIEEPSPAELPLVQAMEELHLPDDELQRPPPASRPSPCRGANFAEHLPTRTLANKGKKTSVSAPRPTETEREGQRGCT
jgi:hypothetical protein